MDSLMNLEWREPIWGWLALYPWLVWVWNGVRSQRRAGDYADAHLMSWAASSLRQQFEWGKLWRPCAIVTAWGLFSIAMAGPRIAETDYRQEHGNDTQVLVALDLSRSMTARDILPTRLQRAKLELHNLFDRARQVKFGLALFAARPHLMTPITADKSVVKHDLASVRYGLLPTEGSNLVGLLNAAAGYFGSGSGARVLLLITDGELSGETDILLSALNAATTQLLQQGISIYVLGMGSVEGAPIQSPEGGWLQYQGRAVVTKLQEIRLQHLALQTNGVYARVSESDADWKKLYDNNIKQLYIKNAVLEGSGDIVWNELYMIFLIPAVLLWLVAHLRLKSKSIVKSLCYSIVMVFGLNGMGLQTVKAEQTDEWRKHAYQSYLEASYMEAQRAYARVAGYQGRLGEGISAYKAGEFPEAIAAFIQAVLDADEDQQRATAIFNLANSYYQLEKYGESVELYRQVLRYDNDHHGARINLGYAQKMLEKSKGGNNISTAGRPGKGPRHRGIARDQDSSDLNLSIDDSEPEQDISSVASEPELRSESEKIDQSIYHAQPVVGRVIEYEDKDWRYSETSAAEVVLQLNAMEGDESVFWKRLFEAEEGFPAPKTSPEVLPGIMPW